MATNPIHQLPSMSSEELLGKKFMKANFATKSSLEGSKRSKISRNKLKKRKKSELNQILFLLRSL
jgi:hypothetical protein